MKSIGIKYCGGCNPIIDRIKLVEKIKKLLPSPFSIAEDQSSNYWDTGILICGCLTSCADKPALRNLARKWIIVAGNSVNHHNAPEKKLAEIIVNKINNSADRLNKA